MFQRLLRELRGGRGGQVSAAEILLFLGVLAYSAVVLQDLGRRSVSTEFGHDETLFSQIPTYLKSGRSSGPLTSLSGRMVIQEPLSPFDPQASIGPAVWLPVVGFERLAGGAPTLRSRQLIFGISIAGILLLPALHLLWNGCQLHALSFYLLLVAGLFRVPKLSEVFFHYKGEAPGTAYFIAGVLGIGFALGAPGRVSGVRRGLVAGGLLGLAVNSKLLLAVAVAASAFFSWAARHGIKIRSVPRTARSIWIAGFGGGLGVLMVWQIVQFLFLGAKGYLHTIKGHVLFFKIYYDLSAWAPEFQAGGEYSGKLRSLLEVMYSAALTPFYLGLAVLVLAVLPGRGRAVPGGPGLPWLSVAAGGLANVLWYLSSSSNAFLRYVSPGVCMLVVGVSGCVAVSLNAVDSRSAPSARSRIGAGLMTGALCAAVWLATVMLPPEGALKVQIEAGPLLAQLDKKIHPTWIVPYSKIFFRRRAEFIGTGIEARGISTAEEPCPVLPVGRTERVALFLPGWAPQGRRSWKCPRDAALPEADAPEVSQLRRMGYVLEICRSDQLVCEDMN